MSEMEQQPICKIALGIEYDGSKYYGWQRQNEVRRHQSNELSVDTVLWSKTRSHS